MQIAELSSPGGGSPHHQVVMKKKLKLSSSLKEHEDIHTQHGAFLFPISSALRGNPSQWRQRTGLLGRGS
jgi:hypothetical protein